MSCGWSFECLSHTPSIVGEEFTNHTGDKFYKHALDMAKRRPLDISFNDVMYNDWMDYYEKNAIVFLLQHPNCHLGIVDEYGKHLTLDEAIPEEQKSDLPSWYRETTRGQTIIQCIICIRSEDDQVLPAVTIQDGLSVCVHHVRLKHHEQ